MSAPRPTSAARSAQSTSQDSIRRRGSSSRRWHPDRSADSILFREGGRSWQTPSSSGSWSKQTKYRRAQLRHCARSPIRTGTCGRSIHIMRTPRRVDVSYFASARVVVRLILKTGRSAGQSTPTRAWSRSCAASLVPHRNQCSDIPADAGTTALAATLHLDSVSDLIGAFLSRFRLSRER